MSLFVLLLLSLSADVFYEVLAVFDVGMVKASVPMVLLVLIISGIVAIFYL